MHGSDDLRHMGPPDLKIAGFCLWVQGRASEDAQDFWDGNWLRVLAHCGAAGAAVQVSGVILRVPELGAWLEQLEHLQSEHTGTAELECVEPNLHAEIALRNGRGTLTVRITPDHLTQAHRFEFAVDQSYLPALITALHRLLLSYPVRGTSCDA